MLDLGASLLKYNSDVSFLFSGEKKINELNVLNVNCHLPPIFFHKLLTPATTSA